MEEPRIGVFVCKCGTNIAGFIDVDSIAEYASTLPNVVFTKVNLFTCSESGCAEIRRGIIENKLDSVVVAACTPRTHEPTFRATCQEAGLNPFMFEFVNIREHVSWVHKENKEDGTKKAKDLIRMGVARAKLLEEQEYIQVPVIQEAAVIGGGIAGITAALSIGRRGFRVHLIEKTDLLGGMLNLLNKAYPDMIDTKTLIKERIEELESLPNVEIYLNSKVSSVAGCIGNYAIEVENKEGEKASFKTGVIIVATGARLPDPKPYYNYDGDKIITQLELEQRLSNPDFEASKDIMMIQCVGSRDRERNYCAKICCNVALKNSILIKKRDDRANVYILYRDLMAYGHDSERLLKEAKELGVRFIHYDTAKPPVIDKNSVRVYNDLMNKEFMLDADLIVLATPLIAREDVAEVSKLLKVPIDENGFFLESHMKLKPVDFANDGIYLCGSAHWPCSIHEAIYQAEAAGSRALVPLGNASVFVEPINSILDEDLCRGCGLCVNLCPYKAIEIVVTEKGKKARIMIAACKGCGVCSATCYRHAIRMNHYSDEQLRAQISACFKE